MARQSAPPEPRGPSPGRPLRIVQVLAAPYPSRQGSQVYVRGMAWALARLGHEVTIACYGHADGEAKSSDGPVRICRTPRPPGYASLRAGPDVMKPLLDTALLGLLWRLAPAADVVHAHNYEAPLAALPACRRYDVPLVYNAHNTMREELPAYFSRARARRWATRVGGWLDQSVPRQADLALAISEAGAQRLRSLGCRNVAYSPPGVDISDLCDANPERARTAHQLRGRSWVVYAGNPDAYQDLDVLVEAMGRLPEAGLLMVSASPLSDWAHACDRAGIGAERRRFVVTRDWPEVRDLVAASDVAALPRSVCSGFPIKLLNYLGLGVPTVVARACAPEILGIVTVPDRDPAAFAAALADLLCDRERRAALGEAGRLAIRREWSWDVRGREIEALYRQLLAGRSRWRRPIP
jgi:glycosyltransferase involved in cell wall biosynthesis